MLAALAANISWSRHGLQPMLAMRAGSWCTRRGCERSEAASPWWQISAHAATGHSHASLAKCKVCNAQGEAASVAKLPRPGGRLVHMLQLAIAIFILSCNMHKVPHTCICRTYAFAAPMQVHMLPPSTCRCRHHAHAAAVQVLQVCRCRKHASAASMHMLCLRPCM